MTDNLKTELKIGRDPHAVVQFVDKHCKEEDQLACISFQTIYFTANVKEIIIIIILSCISKVELE